MFEPRDRRPALLPAIYTMAVGVALLLWGALLANGAGEVGGGLRALGAAEIGVYRVAELPKRGVAGIVAGDAALGGPTLHQRGLCVVGRVATGCNLPLVTLPLGVALAAGVMLLAIGRALAARAGRRARRRAPGGAGRTPGRNWGVLLGAASVALVLIVSSHANGLPTAPDRAGGVGDVASDVRRGRIGLYHARVVTSSERHWGTPRRLAPRLPRLAWTLYQPDTCMQRWRAARGDWRGCNRPLVEIPLVAAWLAGSVGGLVSAWGVLGLTIPVGSSGGRAPQPGVASTGNAAGGATRRRQS